MTDFEERVIDFWCAAYAIRTGRPMTDVERRIADADLLDLTTTAPTGGLRDRAREACLNMGIVAPGFRAIPGGAP